LRAYAVRHKPLSLSFKSCPELDLGDFEPTQSLEPCPNDCPRAQSCVPKNSTMYSRYVQ
jgi:hypothetical protein